jgi:hypothetical protein
MARVRGGVGDNFILFKLPDDVPQGCYVPVAVRAGGFTSNVASVSISANGGACSDETGLPASAIETAHRTGQLNIGTVALSHIDAGPLGKSNEAGAAFRRYSVDAIRQAFAPAAVGFSIPSAFAIPPLGTCTVTPGSPLDPGNPFDLPGDPTQPQSFNVGQALNLAGPTNSGPLPGPGYHRDFGENEFVAGDYSVDNGSGTQTFGAFKASITLPAAIQWTNKVDDGSVVGRTSDLTVTWTGGVADKEYAFIVGASSNEKATAGFFCTERVSAGRFTVPAWVLSSLPATASFTFDGQTFPGAFLGIGTSPLTTTGRFDAPGLDFAVVTYEQAVATLVSYQ